MMTFVMMETTMKNVAGMVETVVDLMLIQHIVLLVNALIQMQPYQQLRDPQDLVVLQNILMMVIVMIIITIKIVFGMVMTAVAPMLRQPIVQHVNVLIQITPIHQLPQLPLTQVLQLHLFYPLTVVCIILIVLQISNLAILLFYYSEETSFGKGPHGSVVSSDGYYYVNKVPYLQGKSFFFYSCSKHT